MTTAQALVAAAGHYAAQTGLDERLTSAEKLQGLVLALLPQALKAELVVARDPVEYVRAVLTAARPGLTASAPTAQNASRLAALRLAAYRAALGLLGPQAPADQAGSQGPGAHGAQLTERQAAALVSVLDTELSGVAGAADLAEIAEEAMNAFESDSPRGCAALELLPKALALLQAAGGEVDVPNGDGDAAVCQVSDVCKGIIGRVCQHAWPLTSIAKVLASLRSFPLTADSLKEAVQRATLRARQADAQDLPAMVHQLLMLSTRGCRELILQEVMALFEQREAAVANAPNQRRQLMEVQGMVLLHIDMAAKHDMELGQAWLRQLRGEAPPRLSAFSLAVCFTLAGIQRFEQPVTEALKSLILGAFRDASVLAASPWLPTASSSSAAASSGAGQAAALSAALLQCARNSTHGQGGIVQPMVQLAVALIEAGGSGSSGFGGAKSGGAAAAAAAAADAADAAATAAGGEEGEGGAAAPPGRRAAALGASMLLEVYESQHDFRRDIIRLCHNSLIGAKEEVAAPFIRLLALLVRRNAATIGDHMKEMKVSLEHLIFLPPNSALALLLAVWPICRTKRDAQDYIVMLLRKAMFSRELHARLLAARGFLYLITQELRSGGGAAALDDQPCPSQATMSQLSALSGGGAGGATLLHEVMSFLRRCLTQQPEVRRAVYDGMPALLAADPAVQDSVVEPLLPHFLHFYEQDEQVSPPFKLEACARIQGDGVRLIEPLQHLLACVRRVLLAASNAPLGDESERARFNLIDTELLDRPGGPGDDASATGALRSRFAALRRRLADATLEHFNLDASSAEFGMATAHGQLGHAFADVLLGCMEVAMEDVVQQLTEGVSPGAGANEEGTCEPEALGAALLELFGQHTRLVALAAEGAKKSKKEGSTQAAGGMRRGPGRPTVTAPAAGSAQQAAAVVPIDRRVPVFSLACLAKLLDAIADDGFQLPQGTQASMGADTRLCREAAFPGFALSAALRQLQAAEASELTAAIATGTAGSGEDGTAAAQLFSAPDWRQLARPLFRAVQTVVLSHCKQRPAGGVGGNKKEKEEKEQEAMTQVAMRALQQLLSMGAAGGAQGLAAVCERLPDPSEEAIEEAGLPSFEGLSAAQQRVAGRLPLLHEMFTCLTKPSCARELEAMCGCLSLAAEVLPPAIAGKLADWAVAALRELSNLTYPGAAKALLSLALRGRSAAAAPPQGPAPLRAAAPAREPGCGDDLDLLLDLAADVRQMLNADEEQDGDAEGELFAALNARTLGALLAALGAHVDAVLGNLEWAFSKLRAMAAAARQLEPGSAQARLVAHRAAWERSVLGRLRKVAGVQVLLADSQLIGAPNEALIKSLIRMYKLLGAASKGQLSPGKGSEQRAPSSVFIDLVSWVNKECTPHVYAFIQEVSGEELQAEENEAANEAGEAGEKAAKQVARKKKAAANRAKRESKNVPNLIFQIEEFERLLIRISKAGTCNLMQTARRATNRDFKLRAVAQAENGGEGEAPRAKRHKRQQQREEEEGQEEAEEEEAEEGVQEDAEQMEEDGEEYGEGQGQDE